MLDCLPGDPTARNAAQRFRPMNEADRLASASSSSAGSGRGFLHRQSAHRARPTEAAAPPSHLSARVVPDRRRPGAPASAPGGSGGLDLVMLPAEVSSEEALRRRPFQKFMAASHPQTVSESQRLNPSRAFVVGAERLEAVRQVINAEDLRNNTALHQRPDLEASRRGASGAPRLPFGRSAA